MSIRVKQTLAILASLVVAGVMLLLGLWQMSSYEESTRDVSAERAAQAPVPLADQVSADGAVADVYARRVTLSGTYLPDYQALVGIDNGGKPCRGSSGDAVDCALLRVTTAFRMSDDRVIAVVRNKSLRKYYDPTCAELKAGDEVVVVRQATRPGPELPPE